MQIKQEVFRVIPRVAPAGETVEFTFSGRYAHTDLRTFAGEITVEAVDSDGLFQDGRLPGFTCGNGFDIDGRQPFEKLFCGKADANGKIKISYKLRAEGTVSFRLRCGERVLGVVQAYALRREYLHLRPFRGDMHLHTGYSCCNSEKEHFSPEYMAAVNCQLGLDFIGISDHKQHFPAVKAADLTAQCNGNFVAYPSEEVHLSDLHNIHVLNFGGSHGISCRLHDDDPQFRKKMAEYLKQIPDFGDKWLNHMAAGWHVIWDMIREAGGLMVYCHPFWNPLERIFLPECIREYVFANQLYDGLEVFGATELYEANDICASRYQMQCIAEKRVIPPIGNTDSHRHNTLGFNTTVVFAVENTIEALQSAVRAGNCIALSGHDTHAPRTAGSFALVQYYHFLRRNYYPRHDALCVREADLMFKTLESAVDYGYDEFIIQPYPQHIDGGKPVEKITFAPDKAAFAALKAERAALDAEFWG